MPALKRRIVRAVLFSLMGFQIPLNADEAMLAGFCERKNDLAKGFLAKPFKIPELEQLASGNGQKLYSREFNQRTSARALLQFVQDHDIEGANALFRKVCLFYLECDLDHLLDRDSFYWATEAFINIYRNFGSRGRKNPGRLDAETEDIFIRLAWRFISQVSITPEQIELSREHEGYWYWNSENHWMQEVTIIWSLAEILSEIPAYRGREVSPGHTVLQLAGRYTEYLKAYLRGRACRGFLTEISSDGYNSRMLAMFQTILDHARDERLRRMARDITDLYWLFWAQEQIGGERGGGKVRERSYKGLKAESSFVGCMAWLYFGMGHPNTALLDFILINQMCSSYFPHEAVWRLVAERRSHAPYAVIQRCMGKSTGSASGDEGEKQKCYDMRGHCLKYSWCESGFIIGTVMRPPLDWTAWELGSAQSWHHGLIVEGDGGVERVIPKLVGASDTFGEQYAVQSKGTLICQRLRHKKIEKLRMGVFVSTGLLQRMETDERHLFFDHPRVMAAVCFVEGGFSEYHPGDSAYRKNVTGGKFFANGKDDSPIIIETAAPGMFRSFAAFKGAVRAKDPAVANNELRYVSLYGDSMGMATDYGRAPRLNGKEIDYHPEKVYQSPFVNARFGSGTIAVTVGDNAFALDFK